jgi:hypothetical protein
MADRTPYVFISYDSSDRWVAQQIEAHVRGCGAETFLDHSDIRHGEDIDTTIVEAVSRATEIVVLLTPSALHRPSIWMELGHFWAAGKRMIGLLYRLDPEAVATDERMPIFLKRVRLLALDEIDAYLEDLRQCVRG